jgi:hypothetical protein
MVPLIGSVSKKLCKPLLETPKRELKISHPADGLPRAPTPVAGGLGVNTPPSLDLAAQQGSLRQLAGVKVNQVLVASGIRICDPSSFTGTCYCIYNNLCEFFTTRKNVRKANDREQTRLTPFLGL